MTGILDSSSGLVLAVYPYLVIMTLVIADC
jgi:hypothetical protein